MTRLYCILFVATAASAAVAFWLLYGHSLQSVWIDNGVEETEDLATFTRILSTIAVAALIGAFVTWIVYAFRSPAPRPQDAGREV